MLPELRLPEKNIIRAHIVASLNRYWIENDSPILKLPIQSVDISESLSLPLKLVEITLPDWASHLGVDGCILIPQECLDCVTTEAAWQKVDWFMAAFLMLEAWHERLYEKENNPIHSYSFRLQEWDHRIWEYAWVNRIALFLREWAAVSMNCSADELLGTMPSAEILVTHDVDAVSKTIPIRIK